MNRLKIVIISKNCYPALGPRAHRTTELARELVRLGHIVTIYALLGNFDYREYSKESGITFKNLGISKLGVTDNVGHYNRSFLSKALRRLFSKSFEVPNIELMSMVKTALRNEGEIDYLITIAHPHTIHWGVSNYISDDKSKIKFWVADCGDPFMKDPFNRHAFYFSYLERKWGKLCDYITVPVEQAKDAYYSEFRKKIKVIPQGFDFSDIHISDYKPNRVPTFAYSGVVYKDRRDPTQFIYYLKDVKFDYKFIVYTKNHEFFVPFKDLLGSKLELRSYVPRKHLLYELSRMDFLINIKNSSGVQQPSKLIDYALTQRPVLEISTNFSEETVFNEFLDKNYRNKMQLFAVDNYDIKNVASRFLELYSKVR